MDFSKLAPWNWFKDEEKKVDYIPVNNRNNSIAVKNNTALDIQKSFDELFNLFTKSFEERFNHLSENTLFSKNSWIKPSLDIASQDKEYNIKLELPGVDKKDISIEIVDSSMIIRGEKRFESSQENKNFYKIERSYGSFQRVLNLPEDCETDKIESSYNNGILSITIPKKELQKTNIKQIEIK